MRAYGKGRMAAPTIPCMTDALEHDVDARFSLALAPLTGRWAPVGELSLGARLPAGVTEDLRFNPWRTGPGLRPAGPFNGIRKVAYAASQAGRGAA